MSVVMNEQERKLVEEHLYLVKNIVLATMSINESVQGLGYDDLFQTGCEALCHAALHYKADRGAAFATFADVVIKNKLLSHCRKITRLQTTMLYLDAPSPEYPELTLGDTLPEKNDHTLSDFETLYLLTQAGEHYHGVTQKGMNALKLKCRGHTNVEIARYYGVKPNHVAAWLSRAVSKLRADGFYLQHEGA